MTLVQQISVHCAFVTINFVQHCIKAKQNHFLLHYSGDESIVFKSATTVKRTDAVPTRPFSSVNRSKAAAATGAGSFHGGKASDIQEEEYKHVEIIETFNKVGRFMLC